MRHPLIFDVTGPAAIQQAAAAVQEQLQGAPLLLLINNAEISTPGPLRHMPLDALRQQLKINVVGDAASKHTMEALFDALRRELMPCGVVVIQPGTTQAPRPAACFPIPRRLSDRALDRLIARELGLQGRS